MESDLANLSFAPMIVPSLPMMVSPNKHAGGTGGTGGSSGGSSSPSTSQRLKQIPPEDIVFQVSFPAKLRFKDMFEKLKNCALFVHFCCRNDRLYILSCPREGTLIFFCIPFTCCLVKVYKFNARFCLFPQLLVEILKKSKKHMNNTIELTFTLTKLHVSFRPHSIHIPTAPPGEVPLIGDQVPLLFNFSQLPTINQASLINIPSSILKTRCLEMSVIGDGSHMKLELHPNKLLLSCQNEVDGSAERAIIREHEKKEGHDCCSIQFQEQHGPCIRLEIPIGNFGFFTRSNYLSERVLLAFIPKQPLIIQYKEPTSQIIITCFLPLK